MVEKSQLGLNSPTAFADGKYEKMAEKAHSSAMSSVIYDEPNPVPNKKKDAVAEKGNLFHPVITVPRKMNFNQLDKQLIRFFNACGKTFNAVFTPPPEEASESSTLYSDDTDGSSLTEIKLTEEP